MFRVSCLSASSQTLSFYNKDVRGEIQRVTFDNDRVKRIFHGSFHKVRRSSRGLDRWSRRRSLYPLLLYVGAINHTQSRCNACFKLVQGDRGGCRPVHAQRPDLSQKGETPRGQNSADLILQGEILPLSSSPGGGGGQRSP